ncbi:MAG TPA: hypothetical protein VM141_07345, partial [Planctomycetota bacterium]|nr:hypothetical protein [Planctomycetota bacterium]
ARKQHILLAFKEPTAIGSLVFPAPEASDLEFTISVLKANAPYPPRAKEEGDWIKLKTGDIRHWNCVPVPEGTRTRALRITFAKPGDDISKGLEDIEGDPDVPDLETSEEEGKPEAVPLDGKRAAWKSHIDGMRLLRSRFKNMLPEARIRVNSGRLNAATGEWDALRTEVLSEANPAIYVMEWEKEQSVRGLAIMEIDGEWTAVDVYTGPAGEIKIDGNEHWQEVARYQQETRNYYQPDASNNAEARYIDGVVDFGDDYSTRAVRLRVVQQWAAAGGYPRGVRRDRGAREVQPARCRIYGVAPLQYLGGEPPADPLVAKRLCVYDGETGSLLEEMPSQIDGQIAFDPAGELFAIADSKVMKVDAKALKFEEFVSDLKGPHLLAFDNAGRLYVYDHDSSQRIVRVYDQQGKYLHTIGKPGPKKAGPWDPYSLDQVCSMAVDADEQIWMVYPHENPRRIMLFKTDGTFVRNYLGNTHYGGGGVLDPYDKTRLYWKDTVWELDWAKGTSRVKNLMSMNYWEASPWCFSFRGDLEPIIVDGRRYMTSSPLTVGDRQGVGVVYLYDEKTLTIRMMAAMGNAMAFPFLHTPETLTRLGGKGLDQFRFIWTDRNSDGTVQLDEVTFAPRVPDHALGRFDRTLGVSARSFRYEVKEFLPDGTPVYEEKPMTETLFRLDNGNFFRFGMRSGRAVNEVITPEGKRLWSYDAWCGVSGLYIPPWEPGVATNQLGISGHATAPNLGEFLVIHANTGQMNVWTADGFLAGHITLHTRDPRSHGWPEEYKRGTRLDGLSLGQEHFHHYFCKTEQDGKFYIVAGGNHISVVEVKGLEKYKRIGGTINVTRELRDRVRQWQAARVRKQLFAQAPIIECPKIDGRFTMQTYMQNRDSWPSVEIPKFAELGMAYNEKYLYVIWKADNAGPMKNGGDDFRRYFKTGAAVDILLGTDPKADPDRRAPVPGDLRLLVTVASGKPAAVLYRPVAPGAPKDQAWETSTPAGGTTAFDQVVKLDKVSVAVTSSHEGGYIVLAAVPLDAIGLKITDGMLLKMDWGVMMTEEGNLTTGRIYWANKTAVGTTDEPTEAKMTPDLWGHVRFRDMTNVDLDPRQKKKHDLEDLLEGLPPGDDPEF